MAFVLGMAVALQAGQNKFGVSDSRSVIFESPMRVGEVLLPKGEYKVLHTMDGDNHIMVFTQQRGKNPVEVKIKCTLVPLTAKAPATEKYYVLNASNERVLRELVFRGDTAKHVF
ncbi:MAG TPA: hypothetical protein VFA68_20200 [Terriglobales bacterium]|nr:hypothetical protein [Terriglobales bacterium]